MLKSFSLYISCVATIFFAACSTTASSEENCPENHVTCEVYGPYDDCGNPTCIVEATANSQRTTIYEAVKESAAYTTRDSVAAYLCKFDKLPANYVNQSKGKSMYESKTGKAFSKWNFNPWTTIGVMIGGDNFSNNEGLLPKGSYREADVDYSAKNRGTKRLVYQSGCVIYYTSDHYESFSKLEIP